MHNTLINCIISLIHLVSQFYVKIILERGMFMRCVSWNVNGLRASVKKGFKTFFSEINADIFAIQEIKLQAGQIDLEFEGYYSYWNYAVKKGYSGTAVFTKKKPLSVMYGMKGKLSEEEGRILTLEFDDFFFVNVYTPNAQRTLARLDYRLEWEDEIYAHLLHLDKNKPVIYTGDLNVAHQAIDLKNAKANEGNSGCTVEEREKMTRLLSSGFVDTLRYFEPEAEGLYTWWSYMSTVRERNIGWRIDYFIVSESLMNRVRKSITIPSIKGSDHCPIMLELETNKKNDF